VGRGEEGRRGSGEGGGGKEVKRGRGDEGKRGGGEEGKWGGGRIGRGRNYHRKHPHAWRPSKAPRSGPLREVEARMGQVNIRGDAELLPK
jgi:hypothetical protein